MKDIAESALDVVHEQAKDDGLWMVAKYASEAYLQRALRRLHAAVEGHKIEWRSDQPEGTLGLTAPARSAMTKLSPVEASDPTKDGFISYEAVIEALCTDGSMRYINERNVCEVIRFVGRVREDTLRRLMEDGWLKGYANGGGFWISDA